MLAKNIILEVIRSLLKTAIYFLQTTRTNNKIQLIACKKYLVKFGSSLSTLIGEMKVGFCLGSASRTQNHI